MCTCQDDLNVVCCYVLCVFVHVYYTYLCANHTCMHLSSHSQSMLPRIFELCDKHNIPATFFEVTTALAMAKFHQAECDVVVLEAGIGGRLDATNIFQAPTAQLGIITSVQLDHQKILGDTIEKIAIEKAGIIKAGVPVLVAPGCPISLLQVITLCFPISSPVLFVVRMLNCCICIIFMIVATFVLQ